MIAAELNELALIDRTITQLQSELSGLYQRRQAIVGPRFDTEQSLDNIDLSTINLHLDQKSHRKTKSRR